LVIVYPQDLTFTVLRTGSAVRLSVAGEIDLRNRESLISAAIGALQEPGSLLEIDLSSVTFCDSSGVSGLLAIQRIASNDGKRMVLVNPQGQLERTLVVAGLLERLTGQEVN
jgi:anti-anti-sigma factor